MTRRAYRLIALLGACGCCVFCLCACTTLPPVEVLCGNKVDEDDDKLTDCADPDCAASDDCVGARAMSVKPPFDGGHMKPPLLEGGAAIDAQPDDSGQRADANVDAMMTMPPPDAQVVTPPIDDDAGTEPCPACASNETCVDGKCQPAASPTSGAYSLRLLTGTVPAMNEFSLCYDACVILAGVCPCLPDPYVRIVLVHDGAEQFVGMTDAVDETVTPEFPVHDFDIELAAGDVLRFDVYDEDDPDRDNLLYTCNADLRRVSAEAPRRTEVRCVGLGGLAGRLPYMLTAELIPRLVP